MPKSRANKLTRSNKPYFVRVTITDEKRKPYSVFATVTDEPRKPYSVLVTIMDEHEQTMQKNKRRKVK